MDSEVWQLNPRFFKCLDNLWGKHSIDRFASMNNCQLRSFDSRWWDPRTEAVDCLQLPDEEWREEHSWCNSPWSLLPALLQKRKISGAAAAIIAPV